MGFPDIIYNRPYCLGNVVTSQAYEPCTSLPCTIVEKALSPSGLKFPSLGDINVAQT